LADPAGRLQHVGAVPHRYRGEGGLCARRFVLPQRRAKQHHAAQLLCLQPGDHPHRRRAPLPHGQALHEVAQL